MGPGPSDVVLSIWYSVPEAFGGRPNSSASSVSSTHCRGWKPRLVSGPSEVTQTVDPEILVIPVTTEPFSRDHFQVGWVSPAVPVWISTRYSWFSMPWYPAAATGPQPHSADGPLRPAVMVPVLGGDATAAYMSWQHEGAGPVPPGCVAGTGTRSATTRHTVCSRAVVSAWPSAGSRRPGSSRAVTSRCHTSRYTCRTEVWLDWASSLSKVLALCAGSTRYGWLS